MIFVEFEPLDHRRPSAPLRPNKIGDLFRRVVARCGAELSKFLHYVRLGKNRTQIGIDLFGERRRRARRRDQNVPSRSRKSRDGFGNSRNSRTGM